MKKTEQIAFIDFEMNSNGDMDKEDLEIIQAAVIVCDTNGKILNRYKTFVKPMKHKKIFAYTTFLCGIKQSDMKKAVTFNEMLRKINAITKNCTKIYCWGNVDKYCVWNASMFTPYINKGSQKKLLYKLEDISIQICKATKKGRNLSLIEVAKIYNIVDKKAEAIHHADADAYLLKKVYFHK